MEPLPNLTQSAPSVAVAPSKQAKELHNFLCVLLALLVVAVFGQTLRHEFINYDDNSYVYENPLVLKGLTITGLRQAFFERHVGLWDPLVTLSHMLACQLFGAAAWGHHLFNVLLHAASAVLLFVVLRRMTGALWRSAFAAAVFAIHPLRVESVAWVAERKDVLSGLFFMLTLWSFERYVRVPSKRRYLAVAVFLTCGLMAKPMLVTLPLVLLLLDYWPLNRLFHPGGNSGGNSGGNFSGLNRRVLWEKVPLLGLSLAAAWIAMAAPLQDSVGTAPEVIPLATRLQEVPLGFVAYLGQLVWPAGLTVIYPRPEAALLRWWPVAATLIAGLTAVGFALRKKHPYLWTGWAWNLGMLVPVSGLVQISRHWRADHYTYLPQIGLAIALTWTAAALSSRWKPTALRGGALLILGLLLTVSYRQAALWRHSGTLWTHALRCNSGPVAHNNLGAFLKDQRHRQEAVSHFEEALRLDPDYADAHHNLAVVLEESGQLDGAITHYRAGLKLLPRSGMAHCSLASALSKKGSFAEAFQLYTLALALAPGDARIHGNRGDALARKWRVEQRLLHPEQAPGTIPAPSEAHHSWGVAAELSGRWVDAHREYRAALTAPGNSGPALVSLAWLLATCPDAALRNGNEAVQTALQACRLVPVRKAALLEPLAAAYAEAGRFTDAVTTAHEALSLTDPQANPQMTAALRRELKLYQAGRPLRIGH